MFLGVLVFVENLFFCIIILGKGFDEKVLVLNSFQVVNNFLGYEGVNLLDRIFNLYQGIVNLIVGGWFIILIGFFDVLSKLVDLYYFYFQ